MGDFPNPRTGGAWAHKGLQRVWNRAVKAVGLPPISLYEGTKHSFATDAIRRGVPDRLVQRFLGHKNIESTRRYVRLADNALLEVFPPSDPHRQAADKGSGNNTETGHGVGGGPSRTRTWDRPVTNWLR